MTGYTALTVGRTATKAEFFKALEETIRALLTGEKNWVANLANTSAVLFKEWNRRSPGGVNWLGFYVVDDVRGGLVLGPFQGEVACIRIPVGKGVCGAAASARTTVRVLDVHKFPGHIPCDSRSQSELVVPIFKSSGDLAGVLDIDSPVLEFFDEEDQAGIESIVRVVEAACDWP